VRSIAESEDGFGRCEEKCVTGTAGHELDILSAAVRLNPHTTYELEAERQLAVRVGDSNALDLTDISRVSRDNRAIGANVGWPAWTVATAKTERMPQEKVNLVRDTESSRLPLFCAAMAAGWPGARALAGADRRRVVRTDPTCVP
jgi:hypothetical protein